jgi:AraC-like DNA-binding protein
MRLLRWRYNAILPNTNGLVLLTESIEMDQLTLLLNHMSLSAKVFYSGTLCEIVNLDSETQLGQIHLVKSGRLDFLVKEKLITQIDKPSVIFIPRPMAHTIKPTESGGCDLVCASIDLGSNVSSPLSSSLPEFIVLPIEDMQLISPTLHLLFQEAFHEELGRQSALDRIAEYFLIQIIRHVIKTGHVQEGIFAAISDSRLTHAVKAMHEKPAHNWTLDELADICGMSRARFAVNFKTAVGKTPLDYLTDWRISIAQNSIKQGKSLKTLPYSVGYQSNAAFTRVFTKRIGLSPAEWKQSQ